MNHSSPCPFFVKCQAIVSRTHDTPWGQGTESNSKEPWRREGVARDIDLSGALAGLLLKEDPLLVGEDPRKMGADEDTRIPVLLMSLRTSTVTQPSSACGTPDPWGAGCGDNRSPPSVQWRLCEHGSLRCQPCGGKAGGPLPLC